MTSPATTSIDAVMAKSSQRNWPMIGAALAGLALAAYSFTASGYVVTVVGFAAIYGLFCTGLNIFMGYTGQASFGQSAFAALGGYGSAILCTEYNMEPALALVITMAFSGLVALVVGYPTLRLRGHYLAMATFALGLITYEIAIEWVSLTQGYMGYSGIPPLRIGRFEAVTEKQQLAVLFVFLVVGMFASWRLRESRFGRALCAIAGSEQAASALGINVSRYKIMAFVLAALYASAAGSFFAHFVGFISPEVFGTTMAVQSFTMLYLGGIGTVAGPVIGAFIVSMLPELLRGLKEFQDVVYIILLLGILIYAPKGVVGYLTKASRKGEG
jgi:branched-chain amino acid transport system permease protein